MDALETELTPLKLKTVKQMEDLIRSALTVCYETDTPAKDRYVPLIRSVTSAFQEQITVIRKFIEANSGAVLQTKEDALDALQLELTESKRTELAEKKSREAKELQLTAFGETIKEHILEIDRLKEALEAKELELKTKTDDCVKELAAQLEDIDRKCLEKLNAAKAQGKDEALEFIRTVNEQRKIGALAFGPITPDLVALRAGEGVVPPPRNGQSNIVAVDGDLDDPTGSHGGKKSKKQKQKHKRKKTNKIKKLKIK